MPKITLGEKLILKITDKLWPQGLWTNLLKLLFTALFSSFSKLQKLFQAIQRVREMMKVTIITFSLTRAIYMVVELITFVSFAAALRRQTIVCLKADRV